VYAKWTAVMPTTSIQAALACLSTNVVEGDGYAIILNVEETSALQSLSYNDKNVHITITGGTTERTAGLSSTGSLLSWKAA
jgi:hypothetical protein